MNDKHLQNPSFRGNLCGKLWAGAEMQEATVKRISEFPAVEFVTPDRGMRFVRMAVCGNRRFDPSEYARQLVLAQARNGRLMDLPYLIQGIPYDTPAEKWYNALTSDNSPAKCVIGFKGDRAAYERFKDIVTGLDFSQFDITEAEAIRSQYTRTAAAALPVEFDASDAEMGEDE